MVEDARVQNSSGESVVLKGFHQRFLRYLEEGSERSGRILNSLEFFPLHHKRIKDLFVGLWKQKVAKSLEHASLKRKDLLSVVAVVSTSNKKFYSFRVGLFKLLSYE